MNTQSNTVPESPLRSQTIAPAAMSATRPFYWSVRRELWENRSIYIAPLAVAAVELFGFLISTITLPHRMRAVLALDPAEQRAAINMPYDIAAFLIILTAFFVGVFFCLDALHGERRDRSILFWKSLPVSDRTTVLSKASTFRLWFCRCSPSPSAGWVPQ
jgi:ABC-2 type transport system permease protein